MTKTTFKPGKYISLIVGGELFRAKVIERIHRIGGAVWYKTIRTLDGAQLEEEWPASVVKHKAWKPQRKIGGSTKE